MSNLKNPPVPFLDLAPQFERLADEWIGSIKSTGASGQFILGPNVAEFEREFAEFVGTEHAVALGNGTDALVLSLRALGVGPGDEVITTPYTFFASAEAIDHVGATPVFVDIRLHDFNLDPGAVDSAISPRTRAVLPVHIFGAPVDLAAIRAACGERSIEIIEDCAQACGATLGSDRVGSLGRTGTFSFYPTKVLGCFGDGGMVTTDSSAVAESLRKLRNHGATAPFVHDEIGYNSRLDEIQAALLRIKLREIEHSIEGRRRVAAHYEQVFADTEVITPGHVDGHVFNSYTVRVPNRDRVKEHLAKARIGHSLFYPKPLHLQEVYARLGYSPGQLPQSERASRECISLPIFPDMRPEQVEIVGEVLKDAL